MKKLLLNITMLTIAISCSFTLGAQVKIGKNKARTTIDLNRLLKQAPYSSPYARSAKFLKKPPFPASFIRVCKFRALLISSKAPTMTL